MPSGSPPLSSPWSRSLVTAFPSPATAAPSQKPPFRGQWSRPATSRPASSCPRPVRLSLPCLHRFAPDDGSFFASGPLRFPSPGSLNCFPCLHSPPGLLPPSGSKRSTGSAASRLAFRFRPISSRSPPPLNATIIACCTPSGGRRGSRGRPCPAAARSADRCSGR